MRDHYYLHKMLLCTCVETRGLVAGTSEAKEGKNIGSQGLKLGTYLFDDGCLSKLGWIWFCLAIENFRAGAIVGVGIHGVVAKPVPESGSSYRFRSRARASTCRSLACTQTDCQ